MLQANNQNNIGIQMTVSSSSGRCSSTSEEEFITSRHLLSKEKKTVWKRLANIIRETKENCFLGFFPSYIALVHLLFLLAFEVPLLQSSKSLPAIRFTKHTVWHSWSLRQKLMTFWKQITFPSHILYFYLQTSPTDHFRPPKQKLLPSHV